MTARRHKQKNKSEESDVGMQFHFQSISEVGVPHFSRVVCLEKRGLCNGTSPPQNIVAEEGAPRVMQNYCADQY